MPDFNVRSDSVNVEQIMEQIRARIREKRGVDYTEDQIRELAQVKLEKFLDPRGVRSDLLEHFRRSGATVEPLPNYAFEEDTLYESHRGLLRFIRKLLNPLLKLLFNPNRLTQALHIQARLNTLLAEREAQRRATDHLYYEVMHNLVLETTRMSIEVKNLKMRLESVASRLEFTERRSRALESVVVYKAAPEERYERPARVAPGPQPAQSPASAPSSPSAPSSQSSPSSHSSQNSQGSPASPGPHVSPGTPEGPGQRSRRRRRRRGRRGAASAEALMGPQGASTPAPAGGPEGDGGDGSDDGPRDSEINTVPEEADRRESRPEPIEQSFGAEAHPAEPVTRDPDDSQ